MFRDLTFVDPLPEPTSKSKNVGQPNLPDNRKPAPLILIHRLSSSATGGETQIQARRTHVNNFDSTFNANGCKFGRRG